MKMAGQNPRHAWKGRAIAAAIVLLSAAALWYAFDRSSRYPSTDDASIDADVVHVASPVGGRIVRVPVEENQHVSRGDVLFEIDPVPYRLALAQAQAEVELARAALATRRRTLIGETSNATIAADQTRRATHNYDLATRSVDRLRPLAAQGFVSAQQLDQAVVAQRDAGVSLAQAKVQQRSSAQTIGDDADAIAALQAREAALAIAQHALDDTVVRAPFDGYVTGLTILAGETVAPNQSIFTLVHSGEWFAVANFRETALSAIEVGDCATVYSMIDRRQPMSGKVIGIGAGIMDADRVNLPRSLPYVQQSVNWVRVAQRFPVRVRIEAPVNRLVRIGASAIVEVRHGQSCR
ncbi:multidrug transporter subunit MdtN [Paraburkholderia silvatlantica]|uniref:Multidrug efflux system membrane fusion protein n=1 Tax=Paraburkholderia silvatlantica TaxID=321895 RepID=A0ABR6FVM7_9BURK|nr:multidrug transporter subunit MdtN [Paraburkholderia silvatlantica]MBB2931497.1 multidrug efflux system membrane fusion protein [Paraburkholderia silvatlantica]PVY27839.1 multidrug efflux system membrane fusion protein [Paraburkholderia silvatlantica]PXW34686.1 multidrug efflux system membrane fusion protein [Paraburkholderia silvatlantica]TDQ98552.1 multidrug efflux system membrane fusion protein [Paraburkholderia silvatlantica]